MRDTAGVGVVPLEWVREERSEQRGEASEAASSCLARRYIGWFGWQDFRGGDGDGRLSRLVGMHQARGVARRGVLSPPSACSSGGRWAGD